MSTTDPSQRSLADNSVIKKQNISIHGKKKQSSQILTANVGTPANSTLVTGQHFSSQSSVNSRRKTRAIDPSEDMTKRSQQSSEHRVSSTH